MERKNFPAIDLGDKDNRIAIQVTAENGINKIRETVEAFYVHGLRRDYDHLFIFILSRKLQYHTDTQDLKDDLETLDVWDMDDLLSAVEREVRLQEISDRDDGVMKSLEDFTKAQLPAIVRTLSLGSDKVLGSILQRLEVVIGHPPGSAEAFLKYFSAWNTAETSLAQEEILRFYGYMKDRSHVGSRQILLHAIQNSLSAEEFKQRLPDYQGEYISDGMLIFYPKGIASRLPFSARESYWDEIRGLQFSGWASPMEDYNYWRVGLYMRSLDMNFFYALRQFLRSDIERLRSVLVDLDFRHLN
jgi:hypothetical protein